MIYTTEKLLEIFADAGYKALKKLNKETLEYRKLSRHEPTVIAGKTYHNWREYCNFQLVDYLNENHIYSFINKDNQIELFLENDETQQKINAKLYNFLKSTNLI